MDNNIPASSGNEPPPVPEPTQNTPAASSTDVAPKEERTLCIVMHLLAFAGLLHVTTGAIPLGLSIIAPLVFWLLKKNENASLDIHGKEVINFNISWTIYGLVISAAAFVLAFILIGFLLFPVLWLMYIAWIVLVIIGAIQASDGKLYRYPLTIRFLK
jgi:uncharacterized protein